jgi:hypothetical protein
MKWMWFAFIGTLFLAGCYQIDSGDELREVSVTNNPNLIPHKTGMGQFTALNP